MTKKEITEQKIEQFLRLDPEIYFNIGGHSLNEEAAKKLANWKGKILNFCQLERLDPAAAAYLAKWKGDVLTFENLTVLDAKTAAALSQWQGKELSFGALTALDMENATALGEWKGGDILRLDSIEYLRSNSIISALVNCGVHTLSFNSQKKMRPSFASGLAQWKGKRLFLDSVRFMSPEAAAALAAWQGEEIHLSGLKSLLPETAAQIARWQCKTLVLDGLKELTYTAAEALAQWQGDSLSLAGLEHLDMGTALYLAKWQGKSLVLAKKMWAEQRPLTLSPLAAAVLAHWGGTTLEIGLNCHFQEMTLQSLMRWSGHTIRISHKLKLCIEDVEALAAWQGKRMFIGVENFDVRIAERLAKWQGDILQIGNVKKLTPSVAEAMSHWQGKHLYFPQIEKVSDKCVEAFCKNFRGYMMFDCYAMMSEKAKKMMRNYIDAHIEEAKKYRCDKIPLMHRNFSFTKSQQKIKDRQRAAEIANAPFVFPVIRPSSRPVRFEFKFYAKKITASLTWKEVLANLDKLEIFTNPDTAQNHFCLLGYDNHSYIQTLREDDGYILQVRYYNSNDFFYSDYTHYCACLCPPLKQYDKPRSKSIIEVDEYQHYHSLDTVKEAFRAFWLGAPMPPYLCWRVLEI